MNRRSFVGALVAAIPALATVGAIARAAMPAPKPKSTGRTVMVVACDDLEVGQCSLLRASFQPLTLEMMARMNTLEMMARMKEARTIGVRT